MSDGSTVTKGSVEMVYDSKRGKLVCVADSKSAETVRNTDDGSKMVVKYDKKGVSDAYSVVTKKTKIGDNLKSYNIDGISTNSGTITITQHYAIDKSGDYSVIATETVKGKEKLKVSSTEMEFKNVQYKTVHSFSNADGTKKGDIAERYTVNGKIVFDANGGKVRDESKSIRNSSTVKITIKENGKTTATILTDAEIIKNKSIICQTLSES